MSLCHYAVLGLGRAPPPTPEEVRKAFLGKAKLWHPDSWVQAGAEAGKRAEFCFKLVNEANNILSDPFSRQAYDQSLAASDEPPKAGERGHKPRASSAGPLGSRGRRPSAASLHEAASVAAAAQWRRASLACRPVHPFFQRTALDGAAAQRNERLPRSPYAERLRARRPAALPTQSDRLPRQGRLSQRPLSARHAPASAAGTGCGRGGPGCSAHGAQGLHTRGRGAGADEEAQGQANPCHRGLDSARARPWPSTASSAAAAAAAAAPAPADRAHAVRQRPRTAGAQAAQTTAGAQAAAQACGPARRAQSCSAEGASEGAPTLHAAGTAAASTAGLVGATIAAAATFSSLPREGVLARRAQPPRARCGPGLSAGVAHVSPSAARQHAPQAWSHGVPLPSAAEPASAAAAAGGEGGAAAPPPTPPHRAGAGIDTALPSAAARASTAPAAALPAGGQAGSRLAWEGRPQPRPQSQHRLASSGSAERASASGGSKVAEEGSLLPPRPAPAPVSASKHGGRRSSGYTPSSTGRSPRSRTSQWRDTLAALALLEAPARAHPDDAAHTSAAPTRPVSRAGGGVTGFARCIGAEAQLDAPLPESLPEWRFLGSATHVAPMGGHPAVRVNSAPPCRPGPVEGRASTEEAVSPRRVQQGTQLQHAVRISDPASAARAALAPTGTGSGHLTEAERPISAGTPGHRQDSTSRPRSLSYHGIPLHRYTFFYGQPAPLLQWSLRPASARLPRR